MKNLDELNKVASSYEIPKDLPIRFDGVPYTRIPLSRDDELEVVLICFAEGQTSSVHDHQGSNCVVRVISGKILETLYERNGDTLDLLGSSYLKPGDISGLDGVQVHQLSNLHTKGSVLVNFYSPPFKV